MGCMTFLLQDLFVCSCFVVCLFVCFSIKWINTVLLYVYTSYNWYQAFLIVCTLYNCNAKIEDDKQWKDVG